MPGPVRVVPSRLPERGAGEGVEPRPGRAGGKARGGDRDVSLEHPGIGVALRIGGSAPEEQGAGDVGRPVEVVRSRIDEEEPLRAKGNVALLVHRVVDDGAVVGIPRNRRKAESPESLTLGAEAIELRGGAHLGDPAGRHGVLQPAEETHHGRPVAPVGGADAGQLNLVLARLHAGDGRRREDRLRPVEEARAHETRRLRIDPHGRLAPPETAEGAADGGVGLDPGGAANVRLRGRVQLPPVDVQDRFVRGHHRVGDDHRVVGDVGAAHVEQPRDGVQGGDEEGIGLALAHGAAHPPQLGRARLARKSGGKGHDAGARAPARHRSPHRVHEVLVDRLQADPRGGERLGDSARTPHGDDGRVHPHRSLAREGLREVPLDGGNALLPDREQPEPAPPQLLPRLKVIASVRPEAPTLEAHDEVPGRAREPAHPLAPRPVLRHVLALVRVARRHEVGGDLVLAHRVAQAGEPGARTSGPHVRSVSDCGRGHGRTAKERLRRVLAGRLHATRPNDPARDGLY